MGYLEVIIRTDGESSIVALNRRVGEKPREASVETLHNTSPTYNNRSARHVESGVRIVKEKVRTLICFARVTIAKSHVSLPWYVRFATRIISRSHRGTDGMTRYRRAHGRSRMQRRYVLKSEKKYFTWSSPRQSSKSRRSGTMGFSLESKSNLRSLCLERHTELFCREAFAVFHKRILEMVCCSTASEEPRGNCKLEIKEES